MNCTTAAAALAQTDELAHAETEPPPDSGPEIVIHDDGTPKPPWHPLVRRVMGVDDD